MQSMYCCLALGEMAFQKGAEPKMNMAMNATAKMILRNFRFWYRSQIGQSRESDRISVQKPILLKKSWTKTDTKPSTGICKVMMVRSGFWTGKVFFAQTNAVGSVRRRNRQSQRSATWSENFWENLSQLFLWRQNRKAVQRMAATIKSITEQSKRICLTKPIAKANMTTYRMSKKRIRNFFKRRTMWCNLAFRAFLGGTNQG